MIKLLFKRNKVKEYKDLWKHYKNSNLIANVILIWPKDIAKRKGISTEQIEKILDEKVLIYVLDALKRKKITEKEEQKEKFLEDLLDQTAKLKKLKQQ